MTRYHEASQRAAGPARRSPRGPKPRVRPGGLKAPRRGPKPNTTSVPTPAAHTSRRDHASARQQSRSAAMRAGSARSSPSHRTRVGGARDSSAVSGFMARVQEITPRPGNLDYPMSRQARQRRRRHNRGGPTRMLMIGFGVVATVLVLGTIGAVGYVLSVANSSPSLSELHPLLSGASSQVFAADGERLGYIQSDELRSPVTYTQIPPLLRAATVAIEDQRFYQNNGVDLTGIFRSAVKDVVNGQTLQGASTITMQLVRNLYLGNDLRTFKQKITEAKLAIEYNKHHTKRAILAGYLNSVAYGTVGGQTAI